MAVVTTRKAFSAGQLADADDINSLAEQGIRVFINNSARNTAFGSSPSGCCWIINSNQLQWWNGAKWTALRQSATQAAATILDLPNRCDDPVILPSWHRLDHRVSVPAALNTTPLYPRGGYVNPFRYHADPRQSEFESATSSGGVLEFGQTSTVGVGVTKTLTAQIDADVHIVLVSRGSAGAENFAVADPPVEPYEWLNSGSLYMLRAGGGGGGGEIAETHLRVARGDTIEIHGQHLGDEIAVRHQGRVILNVVGRSAFSPGRGGSQWDLDGVGYRTPTQADGVTPVAEPRYGHTPRVGGKAAQGVTKGSGVAALFTAGSGASFTADGNRGAYRGTLPKWIRSEDRAVFWTLINNMPAAGPVGVTLPSAHWKLIGNGTTLEIGNGGAGYRPFIDGFGGSGPLAPIGTDPDPRKPTTRYGEGGAGGYVGVNGPNKFAYAGGPGACLIRYSKAGVPLAHDPVLT